MKKIMFMLGAIAMAVGVQAATVTWTSQNTYLRIGDTTNTKVANGTLAYLIAEGVFSQSDAVNAFAANGSSSAVLTAAGSAVYGTPGVIGGGAAGDGKIDTTISSDGTSGVASGSAYYVVFYNDNMYVSSAVAINVDPLDPTSGSITFGDAAAVSKALPLDAADGFVSAGWYKAVPEPTSGLLLLVGGALLALRRKRA